MKTKTVPICMNLKLWLKKTYTIKDQHPTTAPTIIFPPIEPSPPAS